MMTPLLLQHEVGPFHFSLSFFVLFSLFLFLFTNLTAVSTCSQGIVISFIKYTVNCS